MLNVDIGVGTADDRDGGKDLPRLDGCGLGGFPGSGLESAGIINWLEKSNSSQPTEKLTCLLGVRAYEGPDLDERTKYSISTVIVRYSYHHGHFKWLLFKKI